MFENRNNQESTIERRMREAEKRWRKEEREEAYRKAEDDVFLEMYKRKLRYDKETWPIFRRVLLLYPLITIFLIILHCMG